MIVQIVQESEERAEIFGDFLCLKPEVFAESLPPKVVYFFSKGSPLKIHTL